MGAPELDRMLDKLGQTTAPASMHKSQDWGQAWGRLLGIFPTRPQDSLMCVRTRPATGAAGSGQISCQSTGKMEVGVKLTRQLNLPVCARAITGNLPNLTLYQLAYTRVMPEDFPGKALWSPSQLQLQPRENHKILCPVLHCKYQDWASFVADMHAIQKVPRGTLKT